MMKILYFSNVQNTFFGIGYFGWYAGMYIVHENRCTVLFEIKNNKHNIQPTINEYE